MSDPFAPNSRDQLVREAQRGFAIMALLLAVLGYVTFDRLAGGRNRLPEHVRNAPIATTVWPNSQDSPHPAQRHADRAMERTRQQFEEERADYQPVSNHVPPSFVAPSRQTKPLTYAASTAADLKAELKPIPAPNSDRVPSPAPDSRLNRSAPAVAIQTAHRSSSPVTASTKDCLDPFESADEIEAVSQPAKLTAVPSNGHPKIDSGSFVPQHELATHIEPAPFQSDAGEAKDSLGFRILERPSLPAQSPELKQVQNPSGAANKHAPVLQGPQPLTHAAGTISDSPNVVSNQSGLSAEEPKSLINVTEKPEVAASAEKSHRVLSGESYYSIAQHYYGDGDLFRALHRFNIARRPETESLVIGMQVEIPDLNQLAKLYPEEVTRHLKADREPATFVSSNAAALPSEPFSSELRDRESPGSDPFREPAGSSPAAELNCVYCTSDGETLFGIAAEQLGQASRYLEILELNRKLLPQQVTGMTILDGGLNLALPSADSKANIDDK